MTMAMTETMTLTITHVDCFQKVFPPQVGNLQQIWLWRGTRFETQSKKDLGTIAKLFGKFDANLSVNTDYYQQYLCARIKYTAEY